MKKNLFLIFSTVIFCSCHGGKSDNASQDSRSTDSSKHERNITPPDDSFSLNGIKFGDAKGLVKAFIDKPGVYDDKNKTSIWFTSSTFCSMFDALDKIPKRDGIRIYFAKKDDKNVIVLVATTQNPDPTWHDDYFLSSPPGYIANQDVNGIPDYSDAGHGAIFYTPNPICTKTDNCNPNSPHYLSCEKALLMVTNYGVDPITSTSEWFSYDLIKQLNDALKAQVSPNNPFDGIRIYFARNLHPETYMGKDVFLHSFVFVTTSPAPADVNIHMDHFDCIPIPAAIHAATTHLLHKDTDITDNGQLCPNHCNGSTLP